MCQILHFSPGRCTNKWRKSLKSPWSCKNWQGKKLLIKERSTPFQNLLTISMVGSPQNLNFSYKFTVLMWSFQDQLKTNYNRIAKLKCVFSYIPKNALQPFYLNREKWCLQWTNNHLRTSNACNTFSLHNKLIYGIKRAIIRYVQPLLRNRKCSGNHSYATIKNRFQLKYLFISIWTVRHLLSGFLRCEVLTTVKSDYTQNNIYHMRSLLIAYLLMFAGHGEVKTEVNIALV